MIAPVRVVAPEDFTVLAGIGAVLCDELSLLIKNVVATTHPEPTEPNGRVMRCPGQDTRFWKEDAVFEVPCPECGHSVELFKDEPKGRCSACGHRFRNPKLNLECAKWCEFAEECLGIKPDRSRPANPGEGPLAGRLIQAVKEQFKGDQPRITHSLLVFQHAKELIAVRGGDPRIILGAALLLEIAKHRDDGSARPAAILGELNLPQPVIDQVCQIIAACLEDGEIDSREFRLVRKSHRLADQS